MQTAKKLLCDWYLVRFVLEDHLMNSDGTFLTLSVIDGEKSECMIFLGKDDSNTGYEVRVYKNKPNDHYVPNKNDNIKSYKENDEYVTFFFDNYVSANDFVSSLSSDHKEFDQRPYREIKANH